jgi:hypothetical protein
MEANEADKTVAGLGVVGSARVVIFNREGWAEGVG